ncbi:MAG: circularly permuted type 2 ATP-grasp protein [Pseudomonadota bacterium]
MAGAEPSPTDALDALISGYAAPESVADEMLGPDGLRPVWRPFLEEFAKLDRAEVTRRFARGDQYLRDAGVFYRFHESGGATERDWPLAHVPVLLGEAEWRGIAAALRQRADLLEAVCADLYGAGDLVRSGMLPPALVAQNPAWLRPLVGVRPASGHFLNFLSFEIGRSPDGSWFVLGDRTEAPSGAGFALENRVATMRTFGEPFRHDHIHRLAGFFRAFREAMGAARPTDGRIAILTPGPGAETYFEHAYIARYLGLMLLEGEDLTVRGSQVEVRTVAGPKPVSLLWRRLDATFADPLELDDRSHIGTPGLVSAVRAGNLELVNALGAGVLQTRAFMAFLPRIAQRVLGRRLLMPNIATWWCGQAAEQAYVIDNAERMTIGPALSLDLPFEATVDTAIAGTFRGEAPDDLGAWIAAKGGRLVGQEAVTLSTTPAWDGAGLQPRPVLLRVFAARTGEGWHVMPGGYARIGQTADATALSLRAGGSVADVWVVSDRPVQGETVRPAPDAPFHRAGQSLLPSRAADNLYWLGRYVERVEGTIRLARAYHLRLAETGRTDDPRVARIAEHMESLGVEHGPALPDSLSHQIGAAIRCAEKVRDRFSPDGWTALRALDAALQRRRPRIGPGDEAARALGLLLRGTAGFGGLVHDNMYRFTGWRFLSIGRALERAMAMAGVLASFASAEAPDGSFDIAVEIGDSVMTHRRRYLIETNRSTVIDLLALDDRNPRSIRFQISVMRSLVEKLPGSDVNGELSTLARAVLRTETTLATADVAAMDDAVLQALKREIADLSDLLSAAYLT